MGTQLGDNLRVSRRSKTQVWTGLLFSSFSETSSEARARTLRRTNLWPHQRHQHREIDQPHLQSSCLCKASAHLFVDNIDRPAHLLPTKNAFLPVKLQICLGRACFFVPQFLLASRHREKQSNTRLVLQ